MTAAEATAAATGGRSTTFARPASVPAAPRRPVSMLPPATTVTLACGVVAAAFAVSRAPALGLAAVAVLALAIPMLVYPEVATLLVVFLVVSDTPSVFVDTFGVPQTAAAVLPFLLLLPLVGHVLHGRRIVVDRVGLLLVVFLVVQLAAATHARDPHAALLRVETFVLEAIVTYVLLTNVIRTPAMVRRVAWAITAAAAALGGLTLFQATTHTYYRTYFGFAHVSADFFYGLIDEPRFQGPIGDPNYFGQALLVAVPFGLVLGMTARSIRMRLLAFGATALTSAGIVLTYSRGAALAFVAILFLMIALGHVRLRYAAILAVVVGVVIATIPAYRDRVASLGSVLGATSPAGAQVAPDASVQGRSVEMRAALLVTESYPLLGVGPGQFPLYYQQYAAAAGGDVHEAVKFGPNKGAAPERVTHDIFLGVAANLGVVGLAVFCSILATCGRRLWRARRHAVAAGGDALLPTACLLALVAYVTTGLFLELAYERYLWLLVAVASAAVRVTIEGPTGARRPSRTSGWRA